MGGMRGVGGCVCVGGMCVCVCVGCGAGTAPLRRLPSFGSRPAGKKEPGGGAAAAGVATQSRAKSVREVKKVDVDFNYNMI